MPRTSKSTRTKKVELLDKPADTEDLETSSVAPFSSEPKKSKMKWYMLIAAVILLGVFVYKNKGMLLAGMVGKTPIFKWQLHQALEKKNGKQEFDNMVIDILVQKEAAAKKISLSQKEIDEKISSLSSQLPPNTTLEDFLKAQGMTKMEFDAAIRNQLLVEKLLANEIKVEDKEVEEFISQNKDSFTSSDSAEIRKQAINYLQQQKLTQKFESWLNSVKQQVTIQSFL